MAKLIATTHGIASFDALSKEPDELRALFGPDDPKRMVMDRAITGWQTACSVSALSVFLQDYDIGSHVVKQVFATFGLDATNIIAQNPYRLIGVEGFTFARADRVAHRIGISTNDPRRIEGAVLWIIRQEAQQGHLFVRRGDLAQLLDVMMQNEYVEAFETDDMSKALMDAVDRLVSSQALVLDPEAGVYLPNHHRFEREGATKLAGFVKPSKLDIDLPAFLAEYEKGHAIELSEAQRDGVRLLVDNRVLVLTGLPGTGKTTVVKTFVRLFQATGITHLLMAPTGIAAKRLAAVTGSDAATIHRTLGYTGERWGFNCYNKFPIGAVIVDEMSMVDQELFYRLLDALHPSTMLVLVGDDAQLPSVGPGNVLRELITCDAIPHVRLTQIFRQALRSEIVLASHRINRGEDLVLDTRSPDSDFQFVNCPDENQLCDLIVKMAEKLKSRNANFQVLSPKYDGMVGVTNLNVRLREALNPDVGASEWKAGKIHFRVGDRVMITKNDYELNVYNGDMGKIDAIRKEDLVIKVHGFNGSVDTPVIIPKSRAVEMIRLAYAITVHKSQGSEFDTIIFPLVKAYGRMRQRNLFYTAVTRAKKKCWLLGDPASVHAAIANDKVVQRNTAFGRAVSEAIKALPGVVGGHERTEKRAPEQPLPGAPGSAEEATK
jgi:exodeoxyribonuclease V alpha subunit